MEEIRLPTDREIASLYGEAPAAVGDMVRRAYVVEHALPELELPAAEMLRTDAGEIRIRYRGPAHLAIGPAPFGLSYELPLRPHLVYGYSDLPPPGGSFGAGWYVAGAAALFMAGLVIGVAVF